VSIGTITEYAFGQEGWTTWVDPENQFTLQHPIPWYFNARADRFQDQDLYFYIDGNLTRLSIDVRNTTSTDLGGAMERLIRNYQMIPGPIQARLFAGPDYVSYTINGKPVGSTIWTYDTTDVGRLVTQDFISIVNGKSVYISYTSPERVFDLYLPDVLKIIQSIKIK